MLGFEVRLVDFNGELTELLLDCPDQRMVDRGVLALPDVVDEDIGDLGDGGVALRRQGLEDQIGLVDAQPEGFDQYMSGLLDTGGPLHDDFFLLWQRARPNGCLSNLAPQPPPDLVGGPSKYPASAAFTPGTTRETSTTARASGGGRNGSTAPEDA